jgi:hypothetical protein
MRTYALITGDPFQGGLTVRKIITAVSDEVAADIADGMLPNNPEWWIAPVEDDEDAT